MSVVVPICHFFLGSIGPSIYHMINVIIMLCIHAFMCRRTICSVHLTIRFMPIRDIMYGARVMQNIDGVLPFTHVGGVWQTKFLFMCKFQGWCGSRLEALVIEVKLSIERDTFGYVGPSVEKLNG